jgi:hypothetical protein
MCARSECAADAIHWEKHNAMVVLGSYWANTPGVEQPDFGVTLWPLLYINYHYLTT